MPLRPFSRPQAGRSEPDGFRAAADPMAPASIGTAAAALVALFVVLLSVFIYLSRLNGANTRPVADTSVADATAPAAPGGGPGSQVVSAADGYQSLSDPRWNYALMVPKNWRSAAVDGGSGLLAQADHDRVVEDPVTGARLALSVWNAPEAQGLADWAARIAPGLQPADGSWQPNAMVAGSPALALWAPESATQPVRYATLLQAGGRLYALSYAALDGGAALADYAKALVSLRWLDASETAGSPDQVPLFPLPAPRYYPSSQLFR